MKLPYPFEFDGEMITDFTPRILSASDLADVRKASGNGGPYSAMRKMGEGAVDSLNGKDERQYVKNAVQQMPFFSLYAALIYAGAKTKSVDYIEGQYTCPKCKTVRRYAKTDDDDMSDHLEDLLRSPAESTEVSYSLTTPVEIKRKDTGEIIESVSDITMRYPSVSDYVKGEVRYPDDDLRLMYYAYGQALISVNGKQVDQTYKQRFGEMIFQRMDAMTINRLSSMLSSNAMGIQIERQCLKCHHIWKADVDIGNFFDFGQ